VALASEFLNLRNKKLNVRTVFESIVYSGFGGIFVVLLDPKNILNAIIIGAAWDKVLLSQIRGYFGNGRKNNEPI